MFVYYFILNFISGAVFWTYDFSLWSVGGVVGLAALMAYLEELITQAFHNRIRAIIVVLFTALYSLFILVDYFRMLHFGYFFHQEDLGLLCETNKNEIADFCNTYILSKKTFFCLLLPIGGVGLSLLLNQLSRHEYIAYYKSVLVSIGTLYALIGGYCHLRYDAGLSVPLFSAPSRFAQTAVVIKQRLIEIESLRDACNHVVAQVDLLDAPTIVLVIGESFSKYHCSLYGYEKETYPFLQEYLEEGKLFLMDDAVAVGDLTHVNMKAILSVGDGTSDFSRVPLFLAVFKAAGYKTYLYDNQYIVGQGLSFLTDESLSRLLYDVRNDHSYPFDEELVDRITLDSVPSLYVIHLMGQHFEYSSRYPKEFERFTTRDYNDQKHASIIAQYDNACLYNDYVVNEIFRKFEHEDAVIIYLSDHGEEVYEFDRNGHGSVVSSKDIRYQLAVPMMAFMTDSFSAKRPNLAESFRESAQLPFMTGYISHALLAIASIQSPFYDSSKSIISEDYKIDIARIVMKDIDYDERIKEYE